MDSKQLRTCSVKREDSRSALRDGGLDESPKVSPWTVSWKSCQRSGGKELTRAASFHWVESVKETGTAGQARHCRSVGLEQRYSSRAELD